MSLRKIAVLAALGAVVIGILNPPAIRGQEPSVPQLKFEVASIRPHKQEAGPQRVNVNFENDGINFRNVTLKNCIQRAYGLKKYQVSGGPGWLADERYDVIAKAEGTATKAQLTQMLQALLAERFKLTAHNETKMRPVYSLVVAKGGAKIQAVKDDGEGAQIGGDSQHALTARNISMTQFASTLAMFRQLDGPVVDQTGLKGVFNISLDFADDVASPDSTSPSLFAALPQQLGLKLEAIKGPVQVLVIDHLERPSEN
jgi:uncharacterized protein (TIGR03435 family)